jgi:hypothetical protein
MFRLVSNHFYAKLIEMFIGNKRNLLKVSFKMDPPFLLSDLYSTFTLFLFPQITK